MDEHECEVTQEDLQNLRNELQDSIDDLHRLISELTDEVRD